MNEERVINMSSVITALIGIVNVAFIALILHRRYNIKRKVSEQKTETGSSNLKYTLVKKSDKSKSAQ